MPLAIISVDHWAGAVGGGLVMLAPGQGRRPVILGQLGHRDVRVTLPYKGSVFDLIWSIVWLFCCSAIVSGDVARMLRQ